MRSAKKIDYTGNKMLQFYVVNQEEHIMKLNLEEQVTGTNEEDRITKDLEKMKESNPDLARRLTNLIANKREAENTDESIVITDAMREGARTNEAFHKHRLQGE